MLNSKKVMLRSLVLIHFIGHRAAPGCASNFMKPFLEVCQYYLSNDITKYKIGGDEIIKKIIKKVIICSI